MANVLLVDADRNFRWTLKFLLEDEGHQVDEAVDAPAATDLLSRRAYDVVLTESCFARGSGLDVLEALFGTSTRCIVTTATLGPETLRAARRLRTCRHLGKPCNVEDLLCAIREAAREARCQKSATWVKGEKFAPAVPMKSVLPRAV